ncbi:hypothetical protein V8G54_037800 [Vigna mungo]|uniref:Uncharacterized protein n=1 Tax=Vigna mungo TaxID=3915 RepID=A0AAQ3MJV8_VIGMU
MYGSLCLTISNIILHNELSSHSNMHHLQRAWECSILPLFIPSVNLMHRQSYENRLLAHLHNFKISSSRNKETNQQFLEMSKQAISKKQEMKQKIKHLCVFDRVATAIENENTKYYPR